MNTVSRSSTLTPLELKIAVSEITQDSFPNVTEALLSSFAASIIPAAMSMHWSSLISSMRLSKMPCTFLYGRGAGSPLRSGSAGRAFAHSIAAVTAASNFAGSLDDE
ncbi:MAG: hypothetical protein A4E28_01538 [Methanocella sp. PtaU1.Bin125]|nr:MAG: hypothetical protein A4E28_01538 [Methanocella sp. PtaU1.Bin125]